MALNDIITRIRARNEVDKGLKSADKSVRGFAKRTKGMFKGLLGPVAAFAGVAGIGLITKKLFEAGSAAVETRSRFESVFGATATAEMDNFNKSFGRMAGISQVALQEVVGTTGAIIQGMGASQEASAKFAQEVTQLAGDLGSFNNIPVAETSRTIQAAMTGERESLKRLGIVINQVQVNQRAFADTGKTVAAELTAQEKATATLALITERAGVAVGDLERTQDSSANTYKRVTATLVDMWTTISLGVLPMFEALLPSVQRFVDYVSANLPKAGEFFVNLAGSMGLIDTEARAIQSSISTINDIAIAEQRRVNTREDMVRVTAELAAKEKELDELKWWDRGTAASIKMGNEIEELAREVELLAVEETALITRTNDLTLAQDIAAQSARNLAIANKAVVDEATLASIDVDPSVVDIASAPRSVGGPGGMAHVPPAPELQASADAMYQFQQAFYGALEPLEEFNNATLSLDETLGRMAGETLVNLGAAFNDAFAAIGAGENVFGSISKAAQKAVAETAAAEGRLEFARGAAKIAAGIFPPNPAAIASGLKHIAAGVAFSAIGGKLGGGGGGGAGAGAGFSGKNDLRPTDDSFAPNRAPSILTIQGSLLDTSDPRQADALASALEDLSGRDVIVQGTG